MYRPIAFLFGLLVIGCQSTPRQVEKLSLEEKKKRLEKLRQELLRLQAQITDLEQAIAAEDTTYAQGRKTPVGFTVLRPRPFTAYFQFQGSVDNRQVVNLSAKVPAPVTRIYVQEGQSVVAGQLLLEQDAEVLRKNLAELRTRLELARTLYEKQKRLYEEGIGAEVQYLTAKNNKEALEAALATLEEQIRNTQIRAPFAGQVDAISARVGELLSPGLPAIRLMSAGQWEVRAEVPESFASATSVGKPVEVYVPDLNLAFASRIAAVSRNISPLSRTFTVTVRDIPAQTQALLRPNMTAYVRLPQNQIPAALVVPVDAVQFQDTTAFVYIARGERARRLRVTILGTEKGEVALAGPLQPGDTVITTGASLLTEGQLIQLVAEGGL